MSPLNSYAQECQATLVTRASAEHYAAQNIDSVVIGGVMPS